MSELKEHYRQYETSHLLERLRLGVNEEAVAAINSLLAERGEAVGPPDPGAAEAVWRPHAESVGRRKPAPTMSVNVVLLGESAFNKVRIAARAFAALTTAALLAGALVALAMQAYGVAVIPALMLVAVWGIGRESFARSLCKAVGTRHSVSVEEWGLAVSGGRKVPWDSVGEVDCSYSQWTTEFLLLNGESLFLVSAGREVGADFARYLDFREYLTGRRL